MNNPTLLSPEDMNSDEARLITDRIRVAMEDIAPLVEQAYVGRAWAALGYETWADYITGEFDGPLRLGRENQRGAVGDLRDAGLSMPAIGDVLGISVGTVYNNLSDLKGWGREFPDRVTGLDGRTHPATPEAPKWNPGAIMSSESVEWYTPRHILDAVVEAMGGIDLDPCADPGRGVPAVTHYTIDDDGLAHGWRGRVYMNPPYGGEIAAWIEKLSAEYEMGNIDEAIALVPIRPDTNWWARLPDHSLATIKGRLRFSGADPAPFPSAAIYLGRNNSDFLRVFVPLSTHVYATATRVIAVAAA